MTENFFYSNNIESAIENSLYSSKLNNQINYDFGVSNYSTSTFNPSKPQYYNQYFQEENKIDGNYTPKAAFMATNFNDVYNNKQIINNTDNLINYTKETTPKYSTKTTNPNISNFNLYNLDGFNIQSSNSIDNSLSNINNNENNYNFMINDYQTSDNYLNNIKKEYTNEVDNNQIINDLYLNNNIEIVNENNGEILENNLLSLSSQKENEIIDLFLSKNTHSTNNQRENPQLTNSARFSNRTFQLKENNAQKNNNIITPNSNMRYSVPTKMSHELSLSSKQKNGIEEISDNNSKEYYRESKGELIKDYAYFEDANKDNRDYMEDQGKSIDNFNGDSNKLLFCIFDGHGGGEVSKYLQENLPIYMKKMLPFKNHFSDITKLFKLLDDKVKDLNVEDVGSTATVIYIEKQNGKRVLYCANVGDSRCVLVNKEGIMRLSHDDRVDDPKEHERIIKQGGIISNGRVYGTLMLSRCFGDWGIKQYGVIVEPHISRIEINQDDLYLIIASDGVWDVIKDEECKGFTEIFADTFDICKNFVEESLNRGSSDNISCFVIALNKEM